MGDGTRENPFNSTDVYRLIAENGHVAEGLDLSEKYFEDGINLTELDLTGAILSGAVLNRAILKGAGLDKCHLEGSRLRRANLKGTHLRRTNLEGADLWRANLEGADLWGANLGEANLVYAHLERADLVGANLEGANLTDAHLEEANLRGAHLEEATLAGANLEGIDLSFAHLEGADLSFAHLEGADLSFAHLEGADLFSTEFSPDTKLADVEWKSYVLDEREKWRLGALENPYRRLKAWYTKAGMYDIAGEFFFREMTAKRKMLKWRPKPWQRAWSKFLSLICGYGEKPFRVAASAAVVIFGLATAYYLWGSFSSNSFWDTLYYSTASFTALGYGQWAPQPTGWAKGMGAAEAIIGVFMMALFLITFVRKMTR